MSGFTDRLVRLLSVTTFLVAALESADGQCLVARPEGYYESMGWGSVVAIHGDVALIGQPRWSLPPPNYWIPTGTVNVYRRNGNTWGGGFGAGFLASDRAGGDGFGAAVALNDDWIVVGAPGKEWPNSGAQGAVYVYHQQAGLWMEDKIDPPTGGNPHLFGASVAVCDDLIVASGGTGPPDYLGSAFAYRHDPQCASNWTQDAQLLPSVTIPGENFAHSVCIARAPHASEYVAVVGADSPTFGAAYVYRRIGTAWLQEARLRPSDPQTDDLFGWSVATNGTSVAVGASRNGTGAVYVFAWNGSAWTQQAKLTPPTPADEGWFGSSVSMSGPSLLVGVGNGGGPKRSAVLYRFDESAWGHEITLHNPETPYWSSFGLPVAIDRGAALVGDPGWRRDSASVTSGAVYFFNIGGAGCDTNCDGSVNQFDIQAFVQLLSGTTETPCSSVAGDANRDGTVNQFDIQPFVDYLTGCG